MITDSHSHLYGDAFDADREQVLARAAAAGVTRQIVVGTDLDSSARALALCADHAQLHATAGLHPHDARTFDARVAAELERLCAREDCVGVGEMGLDLFRKNSPFEAQQMCFRWQLELARALNKPAVIHSRDAHHETLAVLRSVPGVRGVMHCYSLGAEELAAYLELGLCISFSGMVTYPKNSRNRAAASLVPLERLLVETDCPFLAPQSRRGQRNEPAFARDVLEAVAQARGADVSELARATSRNASALFQLPELTLA